jgi:hypothetical protein
MEEKCWVERKTPPEIPLLHNLTIEACCVEIDVNERRTITCNSCNRKMADEAPAAANQRSKSRGETRRGRGICNNAYVSMKSQWPRCVYVYPMLHVLEAVAKALSQEGLAPLTLYKQKTHEAHLRPWESKAGTIKPFGQFQGPELMQ